MNKSLLLAKPVDMSTGFKDFFDSISLTGAGLVTKGIAAVIAVIALGMLLKTSSDPKGALRKGVAAVGTLAVAVVLALYGDTLFSTVTQAKG
ncbi:hypothetical protein IOD14_04005 [Streptomyces sp. A2-16]|uniref:hypothetical protein n=1 Tax=Streptomyces sp. A2-16 TaxID=2781734 RepID=UPI001BAFF02B|nr:hypothetical protein [Streptomyces sp. A2-16]QUC56021.1 hypothetical protein IOD14_04005 [Streptomyces sp. A2-16]